jgi:lysophospholipase
MNQTSEFLKEAFDSAPYLPAGWREGFFTNQFHHQLRYGFVPAMGPEKKGTIILTHGYGEFIELYFQVMQEYQAMGFDIWAMDFYGFGKSGRDDPRFPHRPSARGMLRHVKDLDFFIHHIIKPVSGKPIIMSTHSMGGHIGLLYLQRHRHIFAGAIMSSPMFDIFRFDMPLSMRPLFRLLFKVASIIGLRNVQVPATPMLWGKITRIGSKLVDSPNGLRAAYNEMMRDAVPEAIVHRPTFGWVSTAYNTIVHSTTDRALRSVTIPVLIGCAGIENLVDISAEERAARLMPNATLVKLPTAHHSIWFENDENYAIWIDAVRKFIHNLT